MGGVGSGGHNKLTPDKVLERFNAIRRNRLRMSYHKWLNYQTILIRGISGVEDENKKLLYCDALRQIKEYRYYRADRRYFKQGNEVYYDNVLA